MGLVLPSEVKVTRDHIAEWISEWDREGSLEDYITQKMVDAGYGEATIMRGAEEVSVIELLLSDLGSYASTDDSGT
jgi:hypothetical protein